MGRSCSTFGWRGKNYTGFRWGKPGVYWRKILGWIFRKWDVRAWTGSNWFRIGTVGGQL